MVGRHHQPNGYEFKQAQGDGAGRSLQSMGHKNQTHSGFWMMEGAEKNTVKIECLLFIVMPVLRKTGLIRHYELINLEE